MASLSRQYQTLLGVAALGISAIVYAGAAAYRTERLTFLRPRPSELLKRPELVHIAGLSGIAFHRPDGLRLDGWYVPPRNGGSVLVMHGAYADRASMAAEVRILVNAGFGVLAFDWPGYGTSEGVPHWGRGERATLEAALDWLSARPEVDPRRIGALGFSMGGYILAQVAASDERLRGVVLEAAPSDILEHARWVCRRWGPFSKAPAIWALILSGMPVNDDPPRNVIGSISPRPVLILASDADPTVPAFMARNLYGAAREPKQLWLIHAATHGHYDRAAPVEYGNRLVDFFTGALRADSRAGVSSAPSVLDP